MSKQEELEKQLELLTGIDTRYLQAAATLLFRRHDLKGCCCKCAPAQQQETQEWSAGITSVAIALWDVGRALPRKSN